MPANGQDREKRRVHCSSDTTIRSSSKVSFLFVKNRHPSDMKHEQQTNRDPGATLPLYKGSGSSRSYMTRHHPSCTGTFGNMARSFSREVGSVESPSSRPCMYPSTATRNRVVVRTGSPTRDDVRRDGLKLLGFRDIYCTKWHPVVSVA